MDNKELQVLKSNLPKQYNDAQLTFISKRTPSAFIKTRPGRGGKSFSYVEVGYVMEMLNSLFGHGAWDWEYNLIEPLSYPHTKQIVITGKLTVRIYDPSNGELKGTLIKTASGGGEVKFSTTIKDAPVDLADDLKGASADALKKAASMIGIAADIYYPNIYTAMTKTHVTEVEALPERDQEEIAEADTVEIRKGLLRQIFAIGRELGVKGKIKLLGLSDDAKKEAIRAFLAENGVKIDSFAKAPAFELELAVEVLQNQLNPQQ